MSNNYYQHKLSKKKSHRKIKASKDCNQHPRIFSVICEALMSQLNKVKGRFQRFQKLQSSLYMRQTQCRKSLNRWLQKFNLKWSIRLKPKHSQLQRQSKHNLKRIQISLIHQRTPTSHHPHLHPNLSNRHKSRIKRLLLAWISHSYLRLVLQSRCSSHLSAPLYQRESKLQLNRAWSMWSRRRQSQPPTLITPSKTVATLNKSMILPFILNKITKMNMSTLLP